jgi:hypothetical protein
VSVTATPVPDVSEKQLQANDPVLSHLWLRQERTWLLQQTALLETNSIKFTMNALLRLDTAQHLARLVVMDDFGVKLFDLTITADENDQHFLLPALERVPEIDQLIAESVRRIYLLSLPDVGDRVLAMADTLQVTHGTGADAIDSRFDRDRALLLERFRDSRHENWRVRYQNYQEHWGVKFPMHIVVDDQVAGYRLTVWTEEIKE